MSAFVFRVVPLGSNWVIRSADDQVIYGYASRERACQVAELAAAELKSQGQEVTLLVADGAAHAQAQAQPQAHGAAA